MIGMGRCIPRWQAYDRRGQIAFSITPPVLDNDKMEWSFPMLLLDDASPDD